MKHNIYGITQDPITKDFMIINDWNPYIPDHLLLYKSENKVVDDFIRYTHINNNLEVNTIEFVPYDQFKDIKFIAKIESYKAIWIEGNILYC